jgi:hypothetical protein
VLTPILAWTLLTAAALAAALWGFVNHAGTYGRSTRLKLPQPNDDDSPPTAGHPSKQLRGDYPGGEHPGVAILSPGRNEAEHLPTVLPELCEQDHPNLTVVFIDDASDDATPQITEEIAARYPHLLVVRNEQPPPPGWMGKCWALHQGYQALQSKIENQKSKIDWLCFTDADIHWHPKLLSTALNFALEEEADLVGVAPTLQFGSASEAIVQLQLILAIGLIIPFEKAMDPSTPYALTSGAFMLVRRSFYDQIGGHEAVKGEMVEDLKIGQALKLAGAKHAIALAGDLQWCRMYDGPADMWEGLTKNAYAGVEHCWWKALLLCAAVLVLNVLPVGYAIAAAVWLALAPGWMPAVTLLLSVAAVLWQARALNAARKVMGVTWPYAWTMPIGSGAYVALILASMIQYHTKGNRWKGRRYGPAQAG